MSNPTTATDSMKTPSASDPLIQFEVMDRAATIQKMLSGLLEDHAGLDNADLREKYQEAEDAVSALYQSAASVVFNQQ